MPHPVFISYARDASHEHAHALYDELGGEQGGLCFLDTEDIEFGDRFPERLVDALFDAQVVVIFAEPLYFSRWYCLLEFRIARTPILRVTEQAGSTTADRDEALQGIVVAMPPRGTDPMMDRFPSLVKATNWPSVQETEKLAELVLARLAKNPPTLRERYESLGDADAARSLLLQATRLPYPQRIGSIPFAPAVGLAESIRESFVGRADDLWRIFDVLTTERGPSGSAAGLTGSLEAQGGFGKTRLALEFLYRFGPAHFPGGLFWINAEQDVELQQYEVLCALSPSTPVIGAVREYPGGVSAALAGALRRIPSEKPVLFVIDNVPEPLPGVPPRPISEWCPAPSEVAVLATSRARVSLGSGGEIIPLEINVLDSEPAVELLAKGGFRTRLTSSEWHSIAAWVGRLPLALELLNRVLVLGAISPEDLHQACCRGGSLTQSLDDAMEALRGSVPRGALMGISEALSISYGRLTTEQQKAARLLAWLAPAPIPDSLLAQFGSGLISTATRAALRSRSIITPVSGGDGTYFGMIHRVLADFFLSQSPAPVEEMEVVATVLEKTVKSLSRAGAVRGTRLREAAPAVVAFVERRVAQGRETDLVTATLDFGNTMGLELWGFGLLESAETLFGKLHQFGVANLGPEHPSTLREMHNLANTVYGRGDLERAQQLGEQVLRSRRRVLGEEDPFTLLTASNLAAILADRGDLEGAQRLQESVLATQRRVLGEEHPDTLSSINNLANTLRERNQLTRAKQLQESVIVSLERVLGPHDVKTLLAMGTLAATLRDSGEAEEAQRLQVKVLDELRQVVGEEHPTTLDVMSELAHTLRIRGSLESATELLEKLVTVRQKVLGGRHQDTTSAAWEYAFLLLKTGNLARARRITKEYLEWLLECDSQSLSFKQRNVREKMQELVTHSSMD